MRLTHAQLLPVKRQLVVAQGNKCAICPQPITAGVDSCLDHDHKTGMIRGALCRNCNGIEGKVKNLATRAKRTGSAAQWLVNLLNYWAAHEARPSNVFHPLHKTQDEKRVKINAKARARRAAKKQG